MLFEGLVAELESSTSTSAFLSGTPSRIYPLVIPQKVPRGAQQTPCVVYERRGVDRQVTYCGTSGLVMSTMQLDSYATTYSEAVQLAEAVKQALLDFNGTLGGVVSVRHAALQSEFDTQDIEPGLYRVTQTWVFWHEE